jgi:hypothetical protein
VAVWRRLRALGTVSPKDGLHILPGRDDCVEAFQWLAQEVEQAKGTAVVMRVESFEGLPDARLIELFQRARARDYKALGDRAARLEKSLGARRPRAPGPAKDELERLRRRYAEIARIDFFEPPAAAEVAARLGSIAERLSGVRPGDATISPASIAAYRDTRWVTRPHPHVDRLACAWLIRRFIDPRAVIRYATTPEAGEVAFDMPGAEFGHRGNLCTFETMVKAFGLTGAALRAMAEIVHEIDLRDGRYARPETAGLDAILRGWQALPDHDRETHGIVLFEGLYTALAHTSARARLRRRG